MEYEKRIRTQDEQVKRITANRQCRIDAIIDIINYQVSECIRSKTDCFQINVGEHYERFDEDIIIRLLAEASYRTTKHTKYITIHLK